MGVCFSTPAVLRAAGISLGSRFIDAGEGGDEQSAFYLLGRVGSRRVAFGNAIASANCNGAETNP